MRVIDLLQLLKTRCPMSAEVWFCDEDGRFSSILEGFVFDETAHRVVFHGSYTDTTRAAIQSHADLGG